MFSFFKNRTLREADVRNALSGILGATPIKSVQITAEGKVIVVVEVDPHAAPEMEPVRARAEEVIDRLPGVKKSLVILTSERTASAAPAGAAAALKSGGHKAAKTTGVDLPGVKSVIAVASGKGGVGKSTVAANLALALAAQGKSVGLLDADVYGPSVPRLMGIAGKKPDMGADDRLVPLVAHGIKVMSMGFMVDEDTPMIWRGPIVQSALLQMLRDVAWDGLDVLVIDMPPGTGDIHLTLAQRVPLSGAVVVSTPQDIALLDARKGLEMFRKVAVPILGIVENMSYYCCSQCGHRDDIFGHGGARREAEKLGAPFLGEIPLHAKIRELSDAGTPVVVAEPEGAQALVFKDIARQVLTGLEAASRPAPKIVMG